MAGRMLTYHTQVTINITRLLLHNYDYFVTDMLVSICLLPDLNSFRLPTLIYFLQFFRQKYQAFYASVIMYRHVPFFSNMFHNEMVMGVGVIEAQKKVFWVFLFKSLNKSYPHHTCSTKVLVIVF